MGTLRATLSGEVLEARSQRFKKTMVKHRNGFLLQIASSKAWILCRTPTCSDVAAGSWAFDRLHKRRGQNLLLCILHSFGETSYFAVYFFSRSCLIFNAPNSGNHCHFQAMRAGIMEFGGVHEEEEEADFVAAFGTHSAMAIRRFNSVFRCSGMCRSSDLLPERLGSLAKSMVSLATVSFETNLKSIHEHFDDI